jgi:hypothetical protein
LTARPGQVEHRFVRSLPAVVGSCRCAGIDGTVVQCHAPQLLVPVGIGRDSAVTLLITMGDKPERLNTEASFAALCGVSPIEYSSGRRSSRRLNHGGDRQANAALHRIVFTLSGRGRRARSRASSAERPSMCRSISAIFPAAWSLSASG